MRLDRLEQALPATRLPLEEAVPLFATLLSVPLGDRYAPLHWSPQQQRQKTHEALVSWLVAAAERQPVLAVWEDLHWADPLNTGTARPAAGPDAHGPAADPADLSPGVFPAVDAPLLSDPAHTRPPDTPAGRGDGAAGGGRQGTARRGGATDGG